MSYRLRKIVVGAFSGLVVALAVNATAQTVPAAPKKQKPPTAAAPAGPTLTLDRERGVGKSTAPLVIVEFGDYQCASCRQFQMQLFPTLKEKYIDTGVARYYHKDFPDTANSQAVRAAIVAYCAGRQGKFAAMNQRLYESQAQLGDLVYQDLAKELKLNLERFETCRWGDAAPKVVARDAAEASAHEVSSTPTFFIGRVVQGRMVVEHVRRGATELDALVRDIEESLAASER